MRLFGYLVSWFAAIIIMLFVAIAARSQDRGTASITEFNPIERFYFPILQIDYDCHPGVPNLSGLSQIMQLGPDMSSLQRRLETVRKKQIDSRTIITRPRGVTAPTWNGKSFAFIVPPEIWYFDSTNAAPRFCLPKARLNIDAEPISPPPGTFRPSLADDMDTPIDPSRWTLLHFITNSENCRSNFHIDIWGHLHRVSTP